MKWSHREAMGISHPLGEKKKKKSVCYFTALTQDS